MIVDPSEIRNLLFAFFFAAMIMATGVLYAVLITLARRLNSARLRHASIAAYVVLAGFVVALAWAANLTGPWLVLVGLMLLGYFFMPRMILKLCEGTHMHEDAHVQAAQPLPKEYIGG